MGNAPNASAKLFTGHMNMNGMSGMSSEKILTKLVDAKEWQVLLELLRENPSAAEVRDKVSYQLPIHRAIVKCASLELIEELIKIYPRGLNEKDKMGMNPIHYCVMNKDCDPVLKLILDVDMSYARDVDRNLGKLPIHFALQSKCSMSVFETLIKVYPDSVSRRSKEGKNALHFACENSKGLDFEIIKRLIEMYPSGSGESAGGMLPMHCATENKASLEIVKLLHATYDYGIRDKGKDLKTPLHLAVSNKAPLEVVEYILACCPEVSEFRDRHGRMPLHLALDQNCHPELVLAMLRANGKLASLVGRGGGLPIHLALEKQAASAVILKLLELHPQGAQIPDEYNMLPLRRAIKNGFSTEVIMSLLSTYPEGAAELDEYERLPIHYAASRNVPLIILESLHKACPEGVKVTDNNQQVPLHLSVKRKCPLECLNLLLKEFPQGVNVIDKYNMIPLVYALEVDAPCEMIQRLLEVDPSTAQFRLDGKLMMHLTLELRRSLDVLNLIMNAYPEAAREADDMYGRLPLHWALKRKLPIEILNFLDEAFPLSESAYVKDKKGRLPIFYAVKYHAPTAFVVRLLQAHPSVVYYRDLSFYYQRSDHFGEEEWIDDNGVAITQYWDNEDEDDFLDTKNESLEMMGLQSDQMSLDGNSLAGNSLAGNLSLDSKEIMKITRRRGNKLLLHYAVEDASCPYEIVAELLTLTMPYLTPDFEYNPKHLFTWTYVLSETRDAYVKAVEIVLDRYQSSIDTLNLLLAVPNEEGIPARDCADPKCKFAILKRLFFNARYELHQGYVVHESKNSIIRRAVDKGSLGKPVVLKFIKSKDQFDREVEGRAKVNLSEEFVIPLCRHHDGDFDDFFMQEVNRIGYSKYRYCIVMPAADRDLAGIMLHELFIVNRNWPIIIELLRQVLLSLEHVHSKGLIHGDVKPTNIMRDDGKLKLIDFGASCNVTKKELAGVYKASSAYIPPEMASLPSTSSLPPPSDPKAGVSIHPPAAVPPSLDNGNTDKVIIDEKHDDDSKTEADKSRNNVKEQVDPTSVPGYRLSSKTGQLVSTESNVDNICADYSIDVWAFGVIMYTFCSGGDQLFPCSLDDNLDEEQMRLLALWSDELKAKKLEKVKHIFAFNILSQILSKEIRRRPTVSAILRHPFFDGRKPARIPGMDAEYDICLIYRRTKRRPEFIKPGDWDDETDSGSMDYSAVKKVRMRAVVEEDDKRVDAFRVKLEDAGFRVCDCYEEDGRMKHGTGVNLIKSKSAVVILSRHAVNHKMNSFEKLQPNSYDHMLFQMRLANELSLLGLLEGGISVIAIGDKIKEETDDDDQGPYAKKKTSVVAAADTATTTENTDTEAKSGDVDTETAPQVDTKEGADITINVDTNGVETEAAAIDTSLKKLEEAVLADKLTSNNNEQQQHQGQSEQQQPQSTVKKEEEYAYYYASYNGVLLGRFGNCHPTCPEIIPEDVEGHVMHQLDAEGLGIPVLDRPTVLETVNRIILQPTHFIVGEESKAWSEALAFVQRGGVELTDPYQGEVLPIINEVEDEGNDVEKTVTINEVAVEDDTPSVDGSTKTMELSSSNKRNTAAGAKSKAGRRATVAHSSSADKFTAKDLHSPTSKGSKATKETNKGKGPTGATTTITNKEAQNPSSPVHTQPPQVVFEASDDHVTNVSTIRLLKESLNLKDVAIKNLEQEIEILQRQLLNKHEKKLKR